MAKLFMTILVVMLVLPAAGLPQNLYRAFKNPERVTIVGYDDDAMEPFLTRDGRYLLFNNSNSPAVNTNLHWSERVDDLTFLYRGELTGVNTEALEGVPTVDRGGRLYFVSPREYQVNLSTIYRGQLADGTVSEVAVVPGVSRQRQREVNFDVEISADGETLYFVDALFGTGGPETADLVMARRRGSGFERLAASSRLLRAVNTQALEYAAGISADELELFFTRFSPPALPAIYRAARARRGQPFGMPRRVAAVSGFVEGPTLAPDGRSLYYHRLEGGRFAIFRVTRPRQ